LDPITKTQLVRFTGFELSRLTGPGQYRTGLNNRAGVVDSNKLLDEADSARRAFSGVDDLNTLDKEP
jgi:hypothetical protein